MSLFTQSITQVVFAHTGISQLPGYRVRGNRSFSEQRMVSTSVSFSAVKTFAHKTFAVSGQAAQHSVPQRPTASRTMPRPTSRTQCRVLHTARQGQSGFTLVEIAIVLVIVGLILGGVMKGQALIDNARVRSLATDVSGIQTAWYSFQDRYRSYPGDFPNAAAQIDSAAKPGNGNGKIDDDQERASVWQQLSLAGFIAGNFDGRGSASGTASDVDCNISTCPQNPFNGFYKVSYGSQAENAAGPANEIFTGDQIPVNILAQLDIRLDDGEPDSGRFRVHRAFSQNCTRNGQWDVANGHANCAGVLRE